MKGTKKPGSSAATDNPGKHPVQISPLHRGEFTHKGVNNKMCNDTNMISASNAIKPRQENENAHISNQRFKILSLLQDGQSITSLDALERLGCMRLASRISELRKKGVPIKSRFIRIESGKQVKEYWLECA